MNINTTAGKGTVNGNVNVWPSIDSPMVFLTVLDMSAGSTGKSQTVILSRDEARDLAMALLS